MALDAGITLLDTGDYYAAGHNELLIRDALRGRRRERAVLAILVGARTRERLAEALGALDVELSADDLTQIKEAIPAEAVAGERYHAEQMAILDSERG